MRTLVFYMPVGPTHPRVLNVISVLLALKGKHLGTRLTCFLAGRTAFCSIEKATNETAKYHCHCSVPPAVITTQPVHWEPFNAQQLVQQACT